MDANITYWNCLLLLYLLYRTSATDVKLGVILPDDAKLSWSLKRVVPAIYYAVENVEKRGVLPGCNISVHIANSECSETIGPLAAVDFHMFLNVSVFLGPVCEYAISPVARFSPHWGIPVLTAGAFVTAFDNKSEYKLLTRVHGAYSNGAGFFLNTARTFNWTRLGLIYHDNAQKEVRSDCYFQIQALFYRLKEAFDNENRNGPWNKKINENSPDSYNLEEILKEASLNARTLL